MTEPLTLSLPSDFLDLVARRVIEILDERDQATKPEPWLNARQAAEHLACTTDRIYDLVQLGRLDHRNDGRRLLFKRGDLDRYLGS